MFRYIVILVVFDLIMATGASFVPLLMLEDLISNDVGILKSISAHDDPEELALFVLDLMIFVFAGATGFFYSFQRNFKSRRLGPSLLAATGICLMFLASAIFLIARNDAGYGGEIFGACIALISFANLLYAFRIWQRAFRDRGELDDD